MDKFFMTQEKFNELKNKLEELKTNGREEIANELDKARKEGEYTAEDSSYGGILEKQRRLEEEIAEISNQLKNAVIIEKPKSKGVIDIGSEVIVEFMGKQDKFTLVGEVEADPANGKISNESPVGKALIGKKEGDVVEVKTPVLNMKYKILEVI